MKVLLLMGRIETTQNSPAFAIPAGQLEWQMLVSAMKANHGEGRLGTMWKVL